MTGLWMAGLVRHRGPRLLATAAGIALAVALIASLGAFMTASRATMTTRALATVAVDWQVQIQPGADPATVAELTAALTASPDTRAARTVHFAPTPGLQATTAGTTQTTGPGLVLGVPADYAATFPGQVRQLAGTPGGVQLAQQTASNLHVRPGDHVQISRPGTTPATVTVAGIIDLPQADTLFQRVGAPPQSQPTAPPDNVILLPDPTLAALYPAKTATPSTPAGPAGPAGVTTQIHVARSASLPADPAAAYETVVAAAHNLEAKSAGTALVGNNVGAALGAARSDAAYAQMLFLFLGLPGAVLAALLTAAAVGAGTSRRRAEQALLRTRGLTGPAVIRLAASEALLVGALGAAAGLLIAAATARTLTTPSGGTAPATPVIAAGSLAWAVTAVVFGLAVAAATVLLPTIRDLRGQTVAATRQPVTRDTPRSRRLRTTPRTAAGQRPDRTPVTTSAASPGPFPGGSSQPEAFPSSPGAGRTRLPWWLRAGLDVLLLAAALIVFWSSSADNYALVLAPEGVATVSVSFWAFLGPALLWLGAAGLLARIVLTVLTHAHRPMAAALRPLTGRLARPGAASLSRQRPALARAIVLLALALSFAASTATFNATYQQQAEADAQLTNGADVTASVPTSTTVPATTVNALSSIPGVRHVEPVQHRFAYVGSDLQDLYGVRPDTIGSVTALQDSYFTGGTAAQLMARLQARPDSVLVSAETVKDFQLNPGDLINLRLQDRTTKALKTVPFHFAGVVNEFPTAPKDSFFVANANYIAHATGDPATGAYLLDTGGTDQPRVAADVRHRLGTTVTVTDITTTRGKVGSSLTSVNLAGLTRIELAFAVVLAASAGGLVLILSLTERRRTLAIMSVLGAARTQLRGLVIGESLLIMAAGLAGGALIGAALSQMLVKVLTGVFDPPPSQVAVPWTYLAATVITVTAALFAAALVGARSSTRPAVEQLRDL